MNAEEFLVKAREKISSDPRSRLTLLTKTMLEQPDCVVDIHAHIFDKKCLSIGFILLRMLKTLTLESLGIEAFDEEVEHMELLTKDEEIIYNEIEVSKLDSDDDWEKLEKELEKTIELNETYELFGYNLKDAFKVLKKKTMLEVLDFYHNEFSITNLPEFSNSKMVTVVLQMDLETGWGISPRRKFREQIEDLKQITKKRPILPFLAIDPRRVDAHGSENLYELFLDAFADENTPFFGVKCYPALGYAPTDIRLDPIFEICAEKNIPILVHCGGEIVSTYKKTIKIKTSTGYKDFDIPGDSRKERARFLNNPSHWKPILNKYKKLKLNFGHFGGDDNWLELSKTGSNQRIEKIFNMMENPDWRVYSDFSFNLVENDLFDKFKTELDSRPTVATRTLYGTDYWVVLPVGELLKEQGKFLKKLSDHQNKMLRENAIEYLLK